jgi:4-methyl-5(b-hydroxyethyl)-thiazole monophosphate biosynthesis
MSTPNAKGCTHPTVFVLWGTHFDEVIAVFAVIGLRQAGVRVKVVGLSGPYAKGAHGLGLQADWSLDEALAAADQAIGVVIPCTTPTFQGLQVDPRVQEFLRQTQDNGSWFVCQ